MESIANLARLPEFLIVSVLILRCVNNYFFELVSPNAIEYPKLLVFFGRIESFQSPFAPETV